MAERTVRVTLPDGKTVEVPLTDSHGEFVDVKAEDGSTVRVKTVVSPAIHAKARFVLDGKPIYASGRGPALSTVQQILSFLALLLWRRKEAQPFPDPDLKS